MIRGFLEFWGISFGFPFFDFQPLKAWHSLHLGTERYMTKPGGATFSCMRPTSEPIFLVPTFKLVFSIPEPVLTHNPKFQNQEISLSDKNVAFTQSLLVGNSLRLMPVFV